MVIQRIRNDLWCFFQENTGLCEPPVSVCNFINKSWILQNTYAYYNIGQGVKLFYAKTFVFLNVYIGLENSKCCNSNFDLNFSWGWYLCMLSNVNGACIRLLTLLFLFIWIQRSQQWSHKSTLSDSVCTSPCPGHGARWKKVQRIQRDKQKRPSTKDNTTDICFIYIQWYKILSSDPSYENLCKLIPLTLNVLIHKIVKILSTSANSCDDWYFLK